MGRNRGRVAVPKGTVKKVMDATINVEDEPEVRVKAEPMSESEAEDKGTTQCINPQHKRGCEMADDSCNLQFYGQRAPLVKVNHPSKRGCARDQIVQRTDWGSNPNGSMVQRTNWGSNPKRRPIGAPTHIQAHHFFFSDRDIFA